MVSCMACSAVTPLRTGDWSKTLKRILFVFMVY
jgi:hypothetical protein